VIAYSPLAQGLLSGRFDEQNRPTAGVRSLNPLFLPENLRRAAPLIGVLRQVADAHDVSCSQVALAWLVRHGCVAAIPGASSVEQLERNVAAADLVLGADEIIALTEAARAFRPLAGRAVVGPLLRSRLRR
jgi:aryl-alcohol dehydrogenase-like predicted oxidoreductase